MEIDAILKEGPGCGLDRVDELGIGLKAVSGKDQDKLVDSPDYDSSFELSFSSVLATSTPKKTARQRD